MRARPTQYRWLIIGLTIVCLILSPLTAAAQGDTDGDGLPDRVDACPTQPGPRENGGCPLPTSIPDSDGDGLVDTVDACPTQPGPRENGGCPVSVPPTATPVPPTAVPDSDGDGLIDTADACPTQPGPRENGGCPLPPPPPPGASPVPDSDGDGLVDTADACPTQSGPRENGGCPLPDTPPSVAASATPVGSVPAPPPDTAPDSDGDGLADDVDGCPFGAGRVEDRGCPFVTATPSPSPTVIMPLAGDPGLPPDSLVTPPPFDLDLPPPVDIPEGCLLRNIGDLPYPVVYYDATYTFENIDYPGYLDWEYGVDYNDQVSAPEIQAVSDDLVAIVAPNAWVPIEKQILVPVPGQGLVLVYRLFAGGWMIPDAFPGEVYLYVGDPPCPTEIYGWPDIETTIPEIDLSFFPYGRSPIAALRPTIPPFQPPSPIVPFTNPDAIQTQQDFIDAWMDVPGICIVRNTGPETLFLLDPADQGDPVALALAGSGQTFGAADTAFNPGDVRIALARVNTARLLALTGDAAQPALYNSVPHFFIYTGPANFQYPLSTNLVPDYANFGFENFETIKLNAAYADDRVGFIEVLKDDCPTVDDTAWWDSVVALPTQLPWVGEIGAGGGLPAIMTAGRSPADPSLPRCFRLGAAETLVCLPPSGGRGFSFLPVDAGSLLVIDTPEGGQPALISDGEVFDAAALTTMLLDDDPVPPPPGSFAPGMQGTLTFLPEVGDETLVGFLVNLGGHSFLLPAVLGGEGCEPGAAFGIIIIGGQAQMCGLGDVDGDGTVDGSDFTIWRRHLGRSAGTPFHAELAILGDGSVRMGDGAFGDSLITGDLGQAIGLLLPAVQKVREAAARTTAACADSAFGLLLPAVQLCDGSVMPGDGSVVPGQIMPLAAFGDGSVVPADLLAAMGDGSVIPGQITQLLVQIMADGSVAPAPLSLIPSAVDLTGDGSVIPGEIIQMGDGSVFVLAPGDNQLLLGDGSVIPAPLGALFGVIGGQAFVVLPPAA